MPQVVNSALRLGDNHAFDQAVMSTILPRGNKGETTMSPSPQNDPHYCLINENNDPAALQTDTSFRAICTYPSEYLAACARRISMIFLKVHVIMERTSGENVRGDDRDQRRERHHGVPPNVNGKSDPLLKHFTF